MSTGYLGDQSKSLENAFFAKRDAEKLEAIRRKLVEEGEIQALVTALGIRDAEVLSHLRSLQISAATLSALALVPIVLVAWADGELDAKERKAVLAAAAAHGIDEKHPGWGFLASWLAARPGPDLRKAWDAYVAALSARLTESARRALKDDLLARTRGVAEATGGFLGLGKKVSVAEQGALDDLARAFPA